jgi:3-oxoacyl-[acyl-carrier protein] reductase
MKLGLEGKRALIGGATSGLGAAIARELAREGCRLVLWARDEGRLREAVDALRAEEGAEAAFVAEDARAPGAGPRVAAQAEAVYGGVDIAVLNAGGPPPVDPVATTEEGWEDALRLLLITPVTLASALLPGMRERRWGRIAAVLSSGIREPIANLAYSNAGRSGLAAWLKTASASVASDGVTINGVVPGRIATPRVRALDEERAVLEGTSAEEVRRVSEAGIPAGRYGDPAEFAAAVTFLVSERARYQTGSIVTVDGGMLRSL